MDKQLARLNDLITGEELETIVKAIEVIHLQGSGYGSIMLEFKNKWLVRAYPTPSIKTTSSARDRGGNNRELPTIQAGYEALQVMQ